ncbi:MAG: hypothetical protein QM708_02770 [Propioniciclava sp.]|uniref:hypothetical protein n=1 Tax=Propioniciclava sp. TaxID=2038686 RepID=UPI0039E32821
MTPGAQPHAIRFRDVVESEITKIITHPVVSYALGIALIGNTFLAAIASNEAIRFGIGSDIAPLSAFAAVMFAPIYAFLVVPVWASASEYPGQFRITLTAVPQRSRLVVAKIVAMVAVVLPAAIVTLTPARLILGMGQGLTAPALLADIGRWVAVYVLMSLFVFGLADVLRSTMAPLASLAVLAIFVNAGFLNWPEGLRFLPDQAAMNALGTPTFEVMELPAGLAAITLAGWSTAAIIASVVVFLRRDG